MTPDEPALPAYAGGLFTDFYELTMAQAYHREGMDGTAVFDLHIRHLPDGWNYFVACGLASAVAATENLAFDQADCDYLAGAGDFDDDFLDRLRGLRFTGRIHAMAEGTPAFPYEPVLQVEAPILEAQLLETVILNQVHVQTLLASKAARIVEAAGGRNVIDFGMRRIHGYDAAMKAARAFWVAGVDGTSNVAAGRQWEIPVRGTMAHSYVQAHDDEYGSFRAFAKIYPESILLVDTYDTLEGVRKVVKLADELGDAFRVRGVRLDSGDLGQLARDSRTILDEAGLEDVAIFASGGLDEHAIADFVADGAPIDGFGVGTHMGVSADQPYLDIVYKLASYAGEPTLKKSTGKRTLPGLKQVWRRTEEGTYADDTIGFADEDSQGDELVKVVMDEGKAKRLPSPGEARDHFAECRGRLPEALRGLDEADEPYAVELTARLEEERDRLERMVA